MDEDVYRLIVGDPDSPCDFDGLEEIISSPPAWQWFLWKLQTRIRAGYRLGLTHQFSCKECGAPIDEEEWTGAIACKMWNWKCDFCGWRLTASGGHAPKTMKRQHMRIMAIRKFWWGMRHD